MGQDGNSRVSEEDLAGASEDLGSRLAFVIDGPCSTEEEGDPTDQPNYVFKRMFRLFPTSDPTVPNTIQIYIACVIFNLALLHQHCAASMEQGHMRRCLLEKSVLLYQSCYQILPAIVASKGVPQVPFDDVVFLLKVGALNNSAQILYECDKYEQARERLAMVEHIICVQGLSDTQSCFTNQEYEGILSNVLLLKPPTVAGAA